MDTNRLYFFHSVLDAVDDPVFVKDQDFKFVFVNNAFVSFFGGHAVDYIGKSDFDFFIETEASAYREKDAEVLQTGVVHTNVERNTDKDGTVRYLSTKKSRLITPKDEVYLVGIIREITQQMNTELKLKQMLSEIRKANETKNEFLANVSHEVRTPLHAVIGFCDLILKQKTSEETSFYVQNILQASSHLKMLIDDILDFSTIESGKLKLKLVPFSPKLFFEECANGFFPLTQQKTGVQLVIEIHESLPECVYGDSTRIKEVVTNLLSNSVKFTEYGIVKLQVYWEENSLVFNVEDSGIGIGEEYLPFVFEPFSQEDATLGKRHSGTGIGLAICKKLIELMDGEITVRSTKGMGTVFSVSIPLEVGEKTCSNLKIEKNLPGAILKILVVEDNPMNRILVQHMLESMGHKVGTCENGKEALEYLQLEIYDLMLLDMQMPVMDGKEVLQHMSESDVLNQIPVLILSASSLENNLEHLPQNVSYLAKPVRMEELKVGITKIMEKIKV